MPPRGGRSGDLFLTIGGDVTPLRGAVKAGKSVLAEFGTAAADIQKEVDRAFANMAGNAPSEAKRIEQSFASTFSKIRENAKAVLNAPSGQAALQIFDVAEEDGSHYIAMELLGGTAARGQRRGCGGQGHRGNQRIGPGAGRRHRDGSGRSAAACRGLAQPGWRA